MAYPAEVKQNIITVPHSFESGEQGDINIYLPWRAKLFRVRSTVVKAIAGTDNGTITVKTGTTTITTITHNASEAYGTEKSASVNQDFLENSAITLTSAKTTAGGKVLVSLEVEILPV